MNNTSKKLDSEIFRPSSRLKLKVRSLYENWLQKCSRNSSGMRDSGQMIAQSWAYYSCYGHQANQEFSSHIPRQQELLPTRPTSASPVQKTERDRGGKIPLWKCVVGIGRKKLSESARVRAALRGESSTLSAPLFPSVSPFIHPLRISPWVPISLPLRYLAELFKHT